MLLLLFALYAAIFVAVAASRMTAQPTGDFFALWSAARFLLDHPASEVYDPAALKAAQLAMGMDPGVNYPFPYPPSFLLALAPLGMLPYGAAYLVAIGATLALYVWATVGSGWRSPATVAALVAPTTTITIVAGQTGFLAAALLAGGFRLTRTQPIAGGILFGLATYKPQMGVLVPVALAAAGLWSGVLAASATAVVLLVATGFVFGPAVWPAWVSNIIAYSGQFAAESSGIAHLMPTVSAALTGQGAPPSVVQLGQIAASAAAVYVVWRCFRFGPSRLAAAALFVATFLATPHAFVYDMPILTTAVLWVIAERHEDGAAFATGEIAILILVMAAPVALVAGRSDFPVMVLALALLLGMIIRRFAQVRAGSRPTSGRQTATA